MKTLLYLGCPSADKPDAGKQLAGGGLSVVWADTVAQAINELHRKDMTLLVDLTTGASALESLRDVRSQFPSTPVFAVVDPKRPDLTTEAVLAGVADVFTRPLIAGDLAHAIDAESNARNRRGDQAAHADRLYSHSPLMRGAMQAAAAAAASDAGVLVCGEDGSGRQLVARTIHLLRYKTPSGFVAVDCADDSGEVERSLFGPAARNAGARSGSSHALERIGRKSLLSEARRGTVYLRNLSSASARVQARLSRVLRDGEAVLSDNGERVEVAVRPIAGGGEEFERACADGLLRPDLVKRLSGQRIDVPALRDRREDIAPLANAFLREICRRRGVPPRMLSRSALALMAALPWRGNAAELRALLENIVAGAQGGRHVGLEDVLAHVRLDGGSVVASKSGSLKDARAAFEREFIGAALERCGGRIAEAAKALGIQRTNLYRKMRALCIKIERD